MKRHDSPTEPKNQVCRSCQRLLSADNFYRSSKHLANIVPKCKQCLRKKASEVYRNNPEPYKKRAHIQRDRLRKYLGEIASKIRSNKGCAVCGEREPCVLDFHHVKPGVPVSRAIGKGITAFTREINKCAVLCANCHRKAHADIVNITETMCCTVNRPSLPKSCVKRTRTLLKMCKRGHPYSTENTGLYTRKDGKPRRVCLACARKKALDYYYKKQPKTSNQGTIYAM